MSTARHDGIDAFSYGYASWECFEDAPYLSLVGAQRHREVFNGSIVPRLFEYRVRYYGEWDRVRVVSDLAQYGARVRCVCEGSLKGHIDWVCVPSRVLGTFGFHLRADGGRVELLGVESGGQCRYRIWYVDNVERVSIMRRLKRLGVDVVVTKTSSHQSDYGCESRQLPRRSSDALVLPRDSIVRWKGW